MISDRRLKIKVGLYRQVKITALATAAKPKTRHKILKVGTHDQKFIYIKGFLCVFSYAWVIKLIGYLIFSIA